MAPMEFSKLLEHHVTDSNLKNEIEKLLVRKINGEELNEEPKIQIINDFVEDKIKFYSKYVKSIDKIQPPDTILLDDLFRDTIREVWREM